METKFIPSKTNSSLGEKIVGGIGSGLLGGLESILASKVNQKAVDTRAKHLSALMPGASQQQVQALAHLGPDVYNQFLKPEYSSIPAQPQQTQMLEQPGKQQFNAPQSQFNPMQYMKGLGSLGFNMPADMAEQFGALSPENQKKVIDQVHSKLPPQYQKALEDALVSSQLPKDEEQQAAPQMQQPQQVIGSPQPGVGPQQPQAPFAVPQTYADLAKKGVGQKNSLAQELAREKFEEKKRADKEKMETAKQEKEQKEINKNNAPFLEKIQAEKPIAQQIRAKVNELLMLEEQGDAPNNPITRAIGSNAPGFINPYNVYNAKSNEIAALKSQATGRPSVFMTQLQQSTKPNTSMSKEERLSLLNELKERSEVIEGIERTSRDLIEENGGKQPKNLDKHATERYLEELSPSSDAQPNSVVEAFGYRFKNSPKGWVLTGETK